MINRLILNELESEISQPEITVLLGPRQVGKTTLLIELEKRCRAKGLTTAFFDLEQPQVLAQMNISDTEMVSKLSGAGQVIFID